MFSSSLTKKFTFLVFSLHILGTLLFTLSYRSDFLVGQLQNLCYILSVLLWAVRIKRTILSRYIRNILVSQCGLILFWYVVRMCKFNLFRGSELLNSYFWYLYYIPIIFIAVLGFFTAMVADKNEKQSKDVLKKYSFVFVIGIILVVLVLTNNLHNLVFVFENNTLYDDYTYNIVYYCIVAFEIPLHLLTYVICTKKSINSVSKNKLWIAPAIYLVFVIYLVLYGRGMLDFRDLLGIEPVKFPEVYIFFTMLIWEAYLQLGLIPVNIGYDDFVKNSSLSIKIENEYGETFLVSKGFRENVNNIAKNNAIEHSIKSDNKIVSWLTDISDINALTEKLNEVNSELSEENELIEQKLKLSEKKTVIEKQNMLYDKMYLATSSRMAAINGILENTGVESEDYRKNLSRACLLGVYVKRKSNLVLISENKQEINTEELAFCIRESVDYLNLCDVTACFMSSAGGMINGQTANAFYDCFENILESAGDDLSAAMVTLSEKDGRTVLSVELSLRNPLEFSLSYENKLIETSLDNIDDTVYIRIREVVS